MAPRKSQGKGNPPSRLASDSLVPLPVPALDESTVQQGDSISIASWASGGSEATRSRILRHLGEDETSPASEIALAEIWLAVLMSDLGVEEISALYRSCLEGEEDERKKEMMGEVFVEIVEVLEEEREDRAKDITNVGGGTGLSHFLNQGKLDGDAIVVEDRDKAPEPGPRGMDVIKQLLETSDIPAQIPTLILQPERLVPLDLHPIQHNPASLHRNHVKKSTTLFYKQSKYNLLRESSEGFSNLIVLLTSSDSLSTSPLDESGPERKERAKRVWSKIMGLIGYFNLSPPRVLDLILEIGSCHVGAHWRFWLDLLRCSPWGGHADVGDVKGKGKDVSVDWQADEVGAIEQCMQGKGDRVLAQVLGVKFNFCQKPDAQGETPSGLVYLAALLLKHGFVSLPDLLPFLSPDDAEMASIRQKHTSAGSSRSGPMNALANSVLLDDEAPSTESAKTEPVAAPSRPPPEQRIQLLQALLAIGHMPAALYFLGRFPWLAQYSPTVADLILRIVEVGIAGVYDTWSDTWRDLAVDVDELGLEAPAPTYRVPRREVVPTVLAPLPPDTPTSKYVFFYPDWAEGLEKWMQIEELRNKGMRWLSLVRGLGGRQVEIMIKICRIGAVYFAGLQKEKEAAQTLGGEQRTRKEKRELLPTEAEMKPWIELLRVSILPSLSASMMTGSFHHEVWLILRYFPYSVRYGLYGEWREETCKLGGPRACPIAAQCHADSTREVKKALSRVTAAQTGQAGGAAGVPDRGPARSLAKLSHSNPCALWATAVAQVKSYSNIGQFIVEAGRYMSPLSYDVATFTLIDTLSADTSTRLNPQGTGVASWLENLSTFVGDFNRRYVTVDLEPVLQFIINRLMRGESADLTILQSLISIMSGETKIDNDAISNDQLKAYGAGREMIRESFNATTLFISKPIAAGDSVAQGAQAAPVDKAKPTKKSLARLISGLRDTGLDMPIWIALAQTRQGAVDKMVGAPIKAMSSMQDNVHDIFIQYGDLLSEQLLSSEHIERTPHLDSLVSEFGLDYAQAFQILRPKLNAEMKRVRATEEAAVAAGLEGTKQTQGSKTTNESPAQPAVSSPKVEVVQMDGEEVEGSEYGSEAATPSTSVAHSMQLQQKKARRSWWPTALTTTMKQALVLLPDEVKEVLSAPFFVIFWHLSMPDISFSAETYQKSIDRLKSLEKEVSSWRAPNNAVQAQHRDERARLKARIDALTQERDAQSNLVNTVNKRRLKLESTKWFGASITQNNLKIKLSQQLHQYCFYPRALLTPSDAVFVPKLIRLMHDLGTPGFVTLFAYGNFFTPHLAGSIFACTENEARNLGRCLAAIMTDLDTWHNDEERYKREAIGIPEGATGSGEDEPKGLPGMYIKGKHREQELPMTWFTFRNFYVAKFHTPMLEALVSCWAETDFMHVKNGITVALQVLQSFPTLTTHGDAVEKAMKALIKRGKAGELTPDVLHQCQAYLRQLKMRQNNKPYIAPAMFFPNGKTATAAPEPAKNAPKGPRAATDTPTVDRRASGPLTPTAPAAAQLGTEATTPKLDAPTGHATPARMADPKILRAKLEESKALRSASAAVKEEPRKGTNSPRREPFADDASKTARSIGRSRSPSTADKLKYEPEAATDIDKEQAPVMSIRGIGAKVGNGDQKIETERIAPSKPLPTGPAKPTVNGIAGLPQRPGSTLRTPVSAPGSTTKSMGPPSTISSADEERAAARAKKFGTVSRGGTPTRPGTPTADSAVAAPALETTQSKRESSRPTSPAGGSRKTSPALARSSRHRSRSLESRASERSNRNREKEGDRERDAREPRSGRERERERARERDKERERRHRGREDDRPLAPTSGRDRTPSTRGKEDEEKKGETGSRDRTPVTRGKEDEERDRKKQEDILRDREGRLDLKANDREEGRRRESKEKDREDRKAKERERERDRNVRGERDSDRYRDRERERERDKESGRERDSKEEQGNGREKEARASAESTGSKRKREDEAPRRNDPITNTRRSDDRAESTHRDSGRRKDDHRDRDRGHDRRDKRRGDERDDRRDGRDDRDARDTRSGRGGDDRRPSRTGVEEKEPPAGPRSSDRGAPPHSAPRAPSSHREPPPHISTNTLSRSSGGRAAQGDATPKRDASPKRNVELLPVVASVVPSPTTGISGASLPMHSGPHGLPARPDSSAPPILPVARGGGAALMSRMAPAPAAHSPRMRSANPSPERQSRPRDELGSGLNGRDGRREEPERSGRREETDGRRRDEAPASLSRRDEHEGSGRRDERERERGGEDKAEPRKRGLDEAMPDAQRDASPGTDPKRIKIDRGKHRNTGPGRSFLDMALKAAAQEQKPE